VYDREIGLYYFNARYYSPELGRFISRDPVGIVDDVNLYVYVGNNPLKWVDWSGLAKLISPNNTDYSKLTSKERFQLMLKFMNSETYNEILKSGRFNSNTEAIDALWIYSVQISNENISTSFTNIYEIVRQKQRINL
jgi:RHS repeat-associated protein